MSNFKKNVIFSAIVIFALFLAFRYYFVIEGFLNKLYSGLASIITGAGLAYVLNIPMCFLERKVFYDIKKGKRALSILSAIIIAVLIVVILFSYIIPRLVDSISLLVTSVPLFLQDLSEYAPDEFDPYIEALNQYLRPLQNLRSFLEEKQDEIVNTVFSFVGSVIGFFVSFILAFAFAIYMLAGKERILEGIGRLMNAYLGRSRADGINNVLTKANSIFKKFFVGQITEACILGSLAAFGMFILRLPYAPAIGALIGVTALIPIAGAWVGAIIGAIMIFPISPVKALVFLLFILILQQTENNVIYPRVVGSSVGLPGIWVLAAITIGASLGGIAGMLIAVPTVALLVALVSEDAENRLNKRKSTFTDSLR